MEKQNALVHSVEAEVIAKVRSLVDDLTCLASIELLGCIGKALAAAMESHRCNDCNGVYSEKIARNRIAAVLYAFELMTNTSVLGTSIPEPELRVIRNFCQTWEG